MDTVNTTEESTNLLTPEWKSIIDKLLPAARAGESLSNPADHRLRMELYRYVMLCVSEAYQLEVAADPDFPLWNSHFLNFPNASFGANPDTLFLSTVLEEDGVYRLWGTRGTSKFFSIQFGTPLNSLGEEGLSRTLDTYNVDALKLGSNGEFEVMVSRTRPADWNGDWWPLKPNTGFAFARQVSYDWLNERDGELHIERHNPKHARTRRKSADEVQQQLDGITRYVVGNAQRWVKYIDKLRKDGMINQFRINRMLDIGGWGEQRYWEGAYDIADDEALVIEITLPERVAYWNIQLSSETWESLDYFNRISSINGAQARPASDGKVYVVVAARDPGIPNWIDTGDYNTGHIYGRWNNASDAPLPVVKRVKFDQVRSQLPADTPAVSNAQRMTEIAQRRRGAQRHFRY